MNKKLTKVRLALAPLLALALLPANALAQSTDFTAPAANYAKAMLKNGRDRYGTQSTPLFASQLDRHAMRLPAARLPSLEAEGVRDYDRAWNGANPMHDQQLYELLFELTEDTGTTAYRSAAKQSLAWFFAGTQNAKTGLLAWGEHLSWDLALERTVQQTTNNHVHEYYESWNLWGRSFDVAPQSVMRFARGLWEHQIYDHTTGLFNRHARYDIHAPGRGQEYPRHGGFYIRTWAEGYALSASPTFRQTMLRAVNVLIDSYEARRKPNGAIPMGTNVAQGRTNQWVTEGNLSQVIDVERAARALPPAAEKLRAFAAKTDAVIVRLPHDLAPGGRGYLQHAAADTLIPNDPSTAYTTMWGEGYGVTTTAEMAGGMLERHGQTGLEEYRTLGLAGAELYLTSEPDAGGDKAIHPAAVSAAIDLMLRAWRLTGDARYLERARHFGSLAVSLFLDDASPLPKATSRHDHYETITGGDDLMLSLYRLGKALQAGGANGLPSTH